MTPTELELQQNIIHTIYALFIHNYIVFAYFFGLLFSLYLAIKSPSRFAVFLSIGFALLTFSFEYDKHIVAGLREQTINSLITAEPHYRLQRWLNILISEVLPILFYLVGWVMIYIALFLKGFKKND